MTAPNLLMTVLMLIAAGVVMMRCLNVMAHMSHRRWNGHQVEFTALSIAYALTGCGAVGMALGWLPGGAVMLSGVALLFFADRRA